MQCEEEWRSLHRELLELQSAVNELFREHQEAIARTVFCMILSIIHVVRPLACNGRGFRRDHFDMVPLAELA